MIAVLDCGTGNLRSVAKAMTHVGGSVTVTKDPAVVRQADRLVFPGQGHFATCMAALRETGLDDAVREVIAAGRPYLGICLGLQVLFESSEEGGQHEGLGVLTGYVQRIRGAKTPHMGWNLTKPFHLTVQDAVVKGGEPQWFYYCHSYSVVPWHLWQVSMTVDYGGPMCAAVKWENVFACQFHLEKSGQSGLDILREWTRW